MEGKVSIIVPIYNVEKYLTQCIESLIGQTYKNIEIVLVDDGSPDNCPKMCDDWAKKDDRIKVLHKQNGGLMAAWRDGSKISTGEYIAFVDSDDFVEPVFIEELYNALTRNGADISIGDYYEYRDGEKKLMSQHTEAKLFTRSESFSCVELLGEKYKFAHGRFNKLYKREIVEACYKYLNTSVTMGEDLNLTFCALNMAKKVAYTPVPVYDYRIVSNSMSHVKKDFWPSYDMVLNAIANYVTEVQAEPHVKKVFYEYVHKFFYYCAKHYHSLKQKENFKNLLKSETLKKYYWPVPAQGSRHKLFKVLYKLKMYNTMLLLMKF